MNREIPIPGIPLEEIPKKTRKLTKGGRLLGENRIKRAIESAPHSPDTISTEELSPYKEPPIPGADIIHVDTDDTDLDTDLDTEIRDEFQNLESTRQPIQIVPEPPEDQLLEIQKAMEKDRPNLPVTRAATPGIGRALDDAISHPDIALPPLPNEIKDPNEPSIPGEEQLAA